MYTSDQLGVAAAGFMCSSTTCQGTTPEGQRAFVTLQGEINRLGRSFGLTHIDPDGKIGPTTLRVLLQLADRLSTHLGANSDAMLNDLLIEIDGRNATTVHDVASKAEGITAVLQRDGMGQAPRSAYFAARAAMQQIVAAGAAGGIAPQMPSGIFPGGGGASSTGNDPYNVTPNGMSPIVTPWGNGANINTYATPSFSFSMPTGWKLWLALGGFVAAVGTVVVVLARRARG